MNFWLFRTKDYMIKWWVLLWLIVGWLVIETGAFLLFRSLDVDSNIAAACLTAIAVVFGYFLTHYLEISRRQREEKLRHYLELMKSLRLFLNEERVKGTETHQQLVDRFQDTYYPWTLLTSKKSYGHLIKFLRSFEAFLKDSSKLTEFTLAQQKLINELRKEFNLEDIEFEPFDIRVPEVSKLS